MPSIRDPVNIAPIPALRDSNDEFQVDPTPPLSPIPQKKISDKEIDQYREQDQYLPIANVSRLMKKCLPGTSKVSKEAKECVQECVSEFISFITSEAGERCGYEKRKTVTGDDVLFAMDSLGFKNYAETLKIYLAKYREIQKNAPPSRRSAAGGGSGGTRHAKAQRHERRTDDEDGEDEGDEDGTDEGPYSDEEGGGEGGVEGDMKDDEGYGT